MFVFSGTYSHTENSKNIGIRQACRSTTAEEIWFSSVLQQADEERKWPQSTVVVAWFRAIPLQNICKKELLFL